ncbi:MAG: response regulator [Verrucomicrobia bacterium]|nr:response regulator [Verrucomicrobiota bacterium]
MNILIVDDNECNRYQLQVLLSGNGYQVTTAAHGAEALDRARQAPPDLIIADILMPVMDGYSLCRAWKQDERLKDIPFVFYTATYTDERDRELALSLGAQRFIVKPEEPDVFIRGIREVIRQTENGASARSQPSALAPKRVPVKAPAEEEAGFLRQYNEVLVRKLEDKLVQLEQVRQELEHDMAERKRVEEHLRKQAALLDAANDAIYVRALDHTVTYWNEGAERLYGWPHVEALGRKITDLGDADPAAFRAAHAVLLEQGSWSGELRKISKAGKERVVFCRWTLLRDGQGRPAEILAINTDITENKLLEAQFLRAQRLEAIGALASGIAHDLNNILAPILMSASLLRETVTEPEGRAMLDTVTSCAQRGSDIIKQLLTFARGRPDARVPLPARHLLREMEKIIRETFPRNIQPCVNAPTDLWPVLGDATQIHQALMNLCVNARDAMPEGGTLTLAAENFTLDAAAATGTPDAKPGNYIRVSVADSGTGIHPEHLDRIFDPFFTTKEIGTGTGLGLATVLGIVRGHGGFVRVKSQVGQGTMFELYLPASPETGTAAVSERESLPPRADGELILVVDDEASVRRMVQCVLEKHGYRVVSAAEGGEAIDIFTRHRAEVRAVITDLMMPGMDGPSLVRALRQMEPHLFILGMTGLAERAGIKGLESLQMPVLLTKPFAVAQLLATLHRAIIAPGEPPPAF